MQMKLIRSRKRLNFLIGLMTLSLFGMAGIQAYWLSNSYQVKEEKFDQEVSLALSGVSKRLENIEQASFISDHFEFQPFFSSKANPYFGFRGKKDSSLHIAGNGNRVEVSLKSRGEIARLNEEAAEPLVTAGFKKDSSFSIVVENVTAIRRRAQKLDVMLNKMLLNEMVLNTFDRKFGVEGRLKDETVDSLIDFELHIRGIDIPYEYSVVENEEVVLQSENWDPSTKNQHKASLFPGDMFGNSLVLLSFPGKTNYILGSMWIMLLISALFTIAMIFTFSRTLSFSLQQKRIGDIKTDFINNMTHEFKTPIATINLAIDALKNPRVINEPSRVRHYSEVIRQENQRMHMQVESVLRMALMEKKELNLNFELTRASELIEDCISHVRLGLENRGGVLQKFLNDTETELMLDKTHMANTIINILDNAIKYSLGSPQIKVATERTRQHFIIIISDKGVGMNREELKHIFDRFYRVGSGNIHNIKGHGLGLSYAKGIIDAHGGRIEVESEKGMGSRFYIYLPLNTTN